MQAINKNNSSPVGSIVQSEILNYPEPPILGAPIFFELIRSYNILNPQNNDNVALYNRPLIGLGIQNPTNYQGFYYKPSQVSPKINFVRKNISRSNPYILLKENEIRTNTAGIEKNFTCLRNTSRIKAAIDDYWNRTIFYDRLSSEERGLVQSDIKFQYFRDSDQAYTGYYPGFHLMFAYLIENTKIFQIFERIVSLYQHGEDLTIPYNQGDLQTRAWIDNSHLLFFSNSLNSICDDYTLLGSNFESMRRNAYHRLFGMDLNHGIGENGSTPISYKRANHFNGEFINQFENFLKLCWQMMINFNNTGNVNTTDLIGIKEQADSLKNMLLARRTTQGDLNNYTYLNLSKIEFQSVIMAEWFNHAISFDSPIVVEMAAEAPTASERLRKLGLRVGISCHSKSSNFIELAPLMASFLRLIELNEIDNDYIAAIANPATLPYSLISTILHNYQLATGKDLKNQVMVNNGYLTKK